MENSGDAKYELQEDAFPFRRGKVAPFVFPRPFPGRTGAVCAIGGLLGQVAEQVARAAGLWAARARPAGTASHPAAVRCALFLPGR